MNKSHKRPSKTQAAQTSGRKKSSHKIIQFDWSRNWKTKVEPYLKEMCVRMAIELGMRAFDKKWKWKDGPHAIGRGAINGQRVTKGKLSWYQPWGCCHWIAFFGLAIGVLNYPDLEWRFVSGQYHTIAVGSRNGEDRVVMDILNFKQMTAEESIALASQVLPKPARSEMNWQKIYRLHIQMFVPWLLETSKHYAAHRLTTRRKNRKPARKGTRSPRNG